MCYGVSQTTWTGEGSMTDDAKSQKSIKSIHAEHLMKLGFARFYGTKILHRDGERSVATRSHLHDQTFLTDEKGYHWIRYSAEGPLPEGIMDRWIP